MQTVYIIGAGAVGKVLAVALSLNNRKVVLLRGSVDHQPAHVERIQVVTANNTLLEADIEVGTLSNHPELDGIIVLTNKSYGNAQLAQALAGKTGSSPLVILQNGLGVEQVFIDHHFPEVYRCVLFVTSQVANNHTVSFKPVAISPIGTIAGNGHNLPAIVALLNTAQFSFREEPNIQPVIWKKAITNCVFNSVCPLLEIDNGIFHRDEKALALATRVIRECVAIAQARGIELTEEEVVENLLLISRLSDGQLISTLQDINNKRPTEIDTLNFAIVEMARSLQQEDAVKETRLLGELTRLKSTLTL
ncbi:MAG: 2-dehydropantoate 2-reductase [Niastella sp.]|nr:2-dehydropantoate 2-reductase [Niastella sp.]